MSSPRPVPGQEDAEAKGHLERAYGRWILPVSIIAEETAARMAKGAQPWTLMVGQDGDRAEDVAGIIEALSF